MNVRHRFLLAAGLVALSGVASLVALVGLAFGDYAIYFLLVPALLTAAVTMAYSYVLYERIEGGSTSPGA